MKSIIALIEELNEQRERRDETAEKCVPARIIDRAE